MHFCKMFKMRLKSLNHKKPKAMHYRRVFKDGTGEDAGYEAGGVWFGQPKAPDSALANARMGRTQPHLGFLTDECLSGRAHHNRALAIGHAQARKVGEVSAKMGEDMGLMYLKGVVGPKALLLFWLKKPSPKMEVAPQNGLRSPISKETHSIANQPHRPEIQAPNKGPLGIPRTISRSQGWQSPLWSCAAGTF